MPPFSSISSFPNRFELEFRAADSADAKDKEAAAESRYARPVMIHRAIYGSFERMIGILTEHFFGKWPFWLSPRQILVISVGVKFNDYTQKVRDTLHDLVSLLTSTWVPNTLQKKVRSGQLQQYNFLFVVGDEEQHLQQCQRS